jgi:nifR3 family TIM-barrel protein
MTPTAPPPLQIGALTLREPLALAPMAGVTDHHFRLIMRRLGGVGLVSMEFVSADAVLAGIAPILSKLRFSEEERPLAVQIYGRDPDRMGACAEVVEELAPDLCDINMGCPANKILKGCAGASLMGDLPRAARIVERCRRALSIPLTVKFRLGLGRSGEPATYLELGRMCEDLGVDAVTLHARSAKQMYAGRADWSAIARLGRALSIPVIGNGDVRSPEDALRMMRETGAQGVMIGRGALLDPWIFRRSWARLCGRPAPPPTLRERYRIIRTHFRWILRDEEPKVALHKLRSFTGRYTQGLPGGRALRRLINEWQEPRCVLEAVDEHFARWLAAPETPAAG